MRWLSRSAPSCHEPWVRPVSSRLRFGSLKNIWQETAKTLSLRKPASRGARKSGATRMSLFSRTTMPFLAARTPAFAPPPNPRLRSSATSLTPGKRSRRNSALPSVEPLSTTMTSFSGLPASAAITEGRYFSRRSRPFQLGITTEAAELSGRASARACRFPTRSHRRAQRASAAAARIRASGQRTNRGTRSKRRMSLRMSLAVEPGTESEEISQFYPTRSRGAIDPLLQAQHPGSALLERRFGRVQHLYAMRQVPALGFELGIQTARPHGLGIVLGLNFGELGGIARRGPLQFLHARRKLLSPLGLSADLGLEIVEREPAAGGCLGELRFEIRDSRECGFQLIRDVGSPQIALFERRGQAHGPLGLGEILRLERSLGGGELLVKLPGPLGLDAVFGFEGGDLSLEAGGGLLELVLQLENEIGRAH